MTRLLPWRNKTPKELFNPRKAVFMDRNGVIIQDSPDHSKQWDEIFVAGSGQESSASATGILKKETPSSFRIFSCALLLYPRMLRGSEFP